MTTFSIPQTMIGTYRGNPVIVRARDLGLMVSTLLKEGLERIAYIQICDLSVDLRPLADLECGGPVDIVLKYPDRVFPELYRLTELVRACPVRVTVPVSPGFHNAVRVAASLHCAVKLEVGQPSPLLIHELLDALEFYLHGSGVTEPIEFFHSVLAAHCHGEPVSLWGIQEEDPAVFRYVCDDGRVTLQGRLAGVKSDDFEGTAAASAMERLSAHPECADCPFRSPCAGYFKWPNPDYACDGMKKVFVGIWDAAQALSKDLDEFEAGQDQARP